jgi:hypothetical protein
VKVLASERASKELCKAPHPEAQKKPYLRWKASTRDGLLSRNVLEANSSN